MMTPKKPDAPHTAPAAMHTTARAAAPAKPVVTAQDFADYARTIANSGAPAGYAARVADLVKSFVERDRLGEHPDPDVLRKHIAEAAKDEGMPAKPVVPVP